MVAHCGQPGIILDACCLLNLYASRQIEAILGTVPTRFAAAEARPPKCSTCGTVEADRMLTSESTLTCNR